MFLTLDSPKANSGISALRGRSTADMLSLMLSGSLIYIVAVFALAGAIKGIIGLGLPTISMGLLAVVVPPVEAAAILILPSLITNVWQMLAGPRLFDVCARLWPMMVAVCLGTWAGLGLMSGAAAPFGTACLGAALAVYAVSGLASIKFSAPRHLEWILGPLVGVVTGLATAATGVFVIPAVPYLQAIGLEKEELVQALGLSFTVSTVALAVNVVAEGGIRVSMAGTTAAALMVACAGMWVGQAIRMRTPTAMFRRWFFVGLLVLGLYLIARSLG
jgi:uncharacterized membrane protein YfcA